MGQSGDFVKEVKKIFFDVNLQQDAGLILKELGQSPKFIHSEKIDKGRSFSNNLKVGTDDHVQVSTHLFQFKETGFDNFNINFGFLIIEVANISSLTKITNIELHYQFDSLEKGQYVFDFFVQKFSSLSTNQKIEKDIQNNTSFAQFSAKESGDPRFQNITIIFGVNPNTKIYEMRILLINEFN